MARRSNGNPLVLSIAFIVCGLGILIFAFLVRPGAGDFDSTTEGQVTNTWHDSSGRKSTSACRVKIVYHVGNEYYSHKPMGGSTGWCNDIGRKVEVHYDKADPGGEAYTSYDRRPKITMTLAAFASFLMGGLLLAWHLAPERMLALRKRLFPWLKGLPATDKQA